MKKLIISFLFIFIFFFFLFSITSSSVQSTLEPHLQKALRSIDAILPYQLVKIMVSPEMAGRLTGDEGYTKAAKWAASKFKEWGLKPLDSRQGYLQSYPSPYTIIDKAEMTLQLASSTSPGSKIEYKDIKLTPGTDFLPLLFAASGQQTAELVFVGWGISAPDLNYDDYAGVEVRGKFVLCFRGTPEPTRLEFQYHDEHRTRMKVAKEKGALGLIYIYPEVLANPNGDWIVDFLPGMISEKVADMIFKEVNSSSAEIRKALENYKRPISFPLKSKLFYSVSSRHLANGIGYNICGWVEGSDPKLKKELIIVGAHFDHCGQHMGLLFPGANDNASGSATVMAIAKAFASLRKKPKRSVMFVLFGGEEMGLQGSTYFAQNLPPGSVSYTHL
ncbi:MAG: M28 family peptidase, partial [Candidatus Aminicenantes bacterium]|nr:M28 family peptidase [Candidatus Aminicenantes bacterium]